MKKFVYSLCLIVLTLGISINASSQVTIKGPVCVRTGITYQYSVTGNWSPTSTMNVCVSGGLIADSTGSNACTPVGTPVSNILVRWGSPGAGSLQLTSAAGNAILNVMVSLTLDPGKIDSLSRFQMIAYNATPKPVTCSGGQGGHCSPTFAYQWQQSSDRVSWMDLPGNTDQNLSFSQSLTQTTFYRRKVNEMGSNKISYSDIAFVVVVGLNSSVDSASIMADKAL